MDYNWGDPKKNSLLSSRMMAKAELTRKKRLTRVKSTLSNQLHPTIEHKLRKKKKALDSARRHCSSEDDGAPSSNNHESQATLAHNENPKQAVPQVASDDESGNLDTIRHDAFPAPAHSSYANEAMFDEFSLNAAADGLFHPASTIEAFAEHDAKYHQEIQDTSEKPHSGPRRARSGSEYPPSRENHRLPALHSGKNKRDRRLASKLQPAGKNGSAPASMTTTSSLSRLLDTGEKEGAKRSLSATQSDSNLCAPRRLDVVPSSSDRNALDFYEHELDIDSHSNNSRPSPRAKTSRAVSELDNNEIPDDGIAAVPPLDFSLARKFEELKKIMKSNRDKHNSDRQSNNEETRGEPATSTRPKSSQGSARNSIRTSSSGSLGSKTEEALEVKSTLKKRSVQAPRATANMNSSSGSKHAVVTHGTGRAGRKTYSNGGAIVTSTRSKREMKARSGVSLSDLKAEHREALQMLKELGGPVDPDYLQTDGDLNAPKSLGAGRNLTKATGNTRGSGLVVSAGGLSHKKSPNQLQACTPASSVSMVTKLRESISSGRSSPASSRESSPAIHSTGITSEATSTVPAPTKGCPAEVSTSAARQSDVRHDEEDGDNNELERAGSTDQKGVLASADRYSDEDFESDL